MYPINLIDCSIVVVITIIIITIIIIIIIITIIITRCGQDGEWMVMHV